MRDTRDLALQKGSRTEYAGRGLVAHFKPLSMECTPPLVESAVDIGETYQPPRQGAGCTNWVSSPHCR